MMLVSNCNIQNVFNPKILLSRTLNEWHSILDELWCRSAISISPMRICSVDLGHSIYFTMSGQPKNELFLLSKRGWESSIDCPVEKVKFVGSRQSTSCHPKRGFLIWKMDQHSRYVLRGRTATFMSVVRVMTTGAKAPRWWSHSKPYHCLSAY